MSLVVVCNCNWTTLSNPGSTLFVGGLDIWTAQAWTGDLARLSAHWMGWDGMGWLHHYYQQSVGRKGDFDTRTRNRQT